QRWACSGSPGDGVATTGRVARHRHQWFPGLQDLAERLSDRFDTRVKVELGQRKGRIVVEFGSVDDLERIVSLMQQNGTKQALQGDV
ncbi:hypothetical protein ACFQ1S_19605, partial [Kibdelosporangium lantanae]